ncbi:glycosyltransferase family 2 protein [Candidatus Peregrinibacteria bacterium]|nr:glycosyltransferase family 2 protein [Candidatus Peregrinibacteria bacterium]
MRLVSIISPVHNEDDCIDELFSKLQAVAAKENNYEFEFIFVDDGSTDGSFEKMVNLAAKHENVKAVELTRSFGKELALTAGLSEAKGEACIMLDADLQHPPELIPKFLREWENGFEVVVGVRNRGVGESFFRRCASAIFYKIMSEIGETPIMPFATDFRLINKVALDAFKKFTEHQRMTRGLIDWLGFKSTNIYFDVEERKNGKTRHSFSKLMRLAASTLVSHSFFPLKLAGYFGVLITLCSGALGIFIMIGRFVIHDPWSLSVSGMGMLATLTIFLVGIILMGLGLVALYIGQIHAEVINRPLYVTRRKINL